MSETKKKIAETREKIAEIPALAVNIRNDIYKAIQSTQGIMQESASLKDVIELSKLSVSAVSNGSYLDDTIVNFFQHYDYTATELNLLRGFLAPYPGKYFIQPHQLHDTFTWAPSTEVIGNTAAYFPTNEAILKRESTTNEHVRISKTVNRNFGTGCKFLCTLYNVESTYQFLFSDDRTATHTAIEPDGTSNTFSTYFGNYYFVASRNSGKLLGPNDFNDLDVVIGPNVNLPIGSDFDYGHMDNNASGVPSIKEQIKAEGSWNSNFRKISINKTSVQSATFPDGNSIAVDKSWMYPLLVELDPLGENFDNSLVNGNEFATGINYAYLKKPKVVFSNNGFQTATVRTSTTPFDGSDNTKQISLQEFAPNIGDILFVKRAVSDIHGDADTLFAIAVVVAPGTQINTDWLPVGDNAGTYTDTNFNNSNGASSQKMTTYSDEKFLTIIGSSWNGSANNTFTQLNQTSFSGLSDSTLSNGSAYTGRYDPLIHDSYNLNPFKPFVGEGFANLQPQQTESFGVDHANITRIANGNINTTAAGFPAIKATLNANDAFLGYYLKYSEANSSTAERISFYTNQPAKFYKLPAINLTINETGFTSQSSTATERTAWYASDDDYYYYYKSMGTAGTTGTFTYANWIPHAPYSLAYDGSATGTGSFLAEHEEWDATKLRPYENFLRVKNFLSDVYTTPGSALWNKMHWKVMNLFAYKNAYDSYDDISTLWSTIEAKAYNGGFSAGTGGGTSALASYTQNYSHFYIRQVSTYWATFTFTGYYYTVNGSGSASTWVNNPNNFKVRIDARAVSGNNIKRFSPDGSTSGTEPLGNYIDLKFGSGTDDMNNVHIGGQNINHSATSAGVVSFSNTTVTRKLYHYAVVDDGTGYAKWQRYYVELTATATNNGSSGWVTSYTGTNNPNLYYNVTWKISVKFGNKDGDPFVAPFAYNMIYSAIRQDSAISVEEGKTGVGYSGGVRVTQTASATATKPYGDFNMANNLYLQQLAKLVYCDAYFENPFDSLYLTEYNSNTAWNDLAGTATPQYKFRQWANAIANCMITESLATTSTVSPIHGTQYTNGSYFSVNDLPLTTVQVEDLKTKWANNAIKMGFGTGSTVTGSFSIDILAPASPTIDSFGNEFYNQTIEIDLESSLGFIPSGLEITDIQFRGDLSGFIHTTPGSYVAQFYSGVFSDTYSGGYEAVYSGTYTDTFTDVFAPSAGYANAFSTTFGGNSAGFVEGYYSGILVYSGPYVSPYSVTTYIGKRYYTGTIYSGTTYSGTGTFSALYSAGFEDPYATGTFYSGVFSGTGYTGSRGFTDTFAALYSTAATTDVNVYNRVYSGAYGDVYSGTVTNSYTGVYSGGTTYSGAYVGSYSRGYEGEGIFYAGTQTVYEEKLTVSLGDLSNADVNKRSLTQIAFSVAGLFDEGEDSSSFKSSPTWTEQKDSFKVATDDYTDVMSDNRKKLKVTVNPTQYVNQIIGSMDRVWEMKLVITGTRFDQEAGAEVFTLPGSSYRTNNQNIGTKFAETNPRFTRAAERFAGNDYHNVNLYSHWFTNNGDSLLKQQFAFGTNNAPFGRLGGTYDYFHTPLNNITSLIDERYKLLGHRIGYPLYEQSNLSILEANTSLNTKQFHTVKYVEAVKANNEHFFTTANSFKISTQYANVTPYGTFYYNLVNFSLEGDHPITAYNQKLGILTFPNEQLSELRNFYELLNGRLKQTYDDTDHS